MSTQPGPANPAISLSTAPEPYVDVKRAAFYLSVAVKTLNEWARLETIPVGILESHLVVVRGAAREAALAEVLKCTNYFKFMRPCKFLIAAFDSQ